MKDIEQTGYEDYWNGYKSNDCPFESIEDVAAWNRGWQRAHTEACNG